jgi:hypothetical protein
MTSDAVRQISIFNRFAAGVLALCLVSPASTQEPDRVSVYLAGGKSATSWHGQSELEAINLELTRPLSPRMDVAFIFAPVQMSQPRSWFGNEYGDGNESVRALSASILLRYKFGVGSQRVNWYMEGGSGPMWADRRVPAATSRFNFMTQAGIGALLFPERRVGVIAGLRFHHISNGGYAPRNPGLNVTGVVLGVQIRR